jgi:indole-3-glycerol phosphate synthase
MSNRLAEILAHKRVEISGLDAGALRAAAEAAPLPGDFGAAVRRRDGGPVRLVAELKRASPSKGLLAPGLDPLAAARVYAENGAAAISVLTDQKFFQGSLEILRALHALGAGPAAREVGVPLLRKDFILSPAQVYQSRAAGADALLLIAAALPDDGALASLHALALELGLAALVEVHSAAELERALRLGGLKLVGINNRDLATFQVSLEVSERLRPLIPPGVAVVAESGIFTAADVARLAAANFDAVLVGEALVTAPDMAARVRELSGGSRQA